MTLEIEKLYTKEELTPEKVALLDTPWEPSYSEDDEAVSEMAEIEGEPEPTEEDLEEMK